jgi:endoglucanase
MSEPPAQPAAVPTALRELLLARGPSGYEAAPARVWQQAASQFAEASIDGVGTPLALVAARHGAAHGTSGCW